MTVSTTTNKVSYIGNGIAVEFAIPFSFLETSHLKVHQLLNDIQTQREDWTVSNGNLVFETAPAKGAQIVIIREVPFTQETDYRENEILAAETLERNFDSLTMQIQQLKEKTDRAVTVDVFDDTQAADLLPNIRTSVSDAATYAATAREKMTEAAQQANNAAASALTASGQAQIATNKAQEVSNALTVKANTDLDNLSETGREKIIHFLMPSYSEMVAITLPYTTPSDGWLLVTAPGNGWVDIKVGSILLFCPGTSRINSHIYPIAKGEIVTLSAQGGVNPNYHFIKCKGT